MAFWTQFIIQDVNRLLGGVGGVVQAEQNRQEKNAQIRRERNRLNTVLTQIDKMVDQGKLDLSEALARIDEHTKGLSQDAKNAIDAATKKGMEGINKMYEASLNELQSNLQFVKEDASRAEQKEIERYEKELDALNKNLRETQEKTRTGTVQRRLTGASAVAALRKNQKVFDEAIGKASELTGRLRSDISFGLQRAINQSNTQMNSLGLRTGAQISQFQGAQGEKLANQLLGIKQSGFQMSEGERKRFQDFQRSAQGERAQLLGGLAGMGTESDQLTPEQIFGSFLGGMSGSQSQPIDFSGFGNSQGGGAGGQKTFPPGQTGLPVGNPNTQGVV